MHAPPVVMDLVSHSMANLSGSQFKVLFALGLRSREVEGRFICWPKYKTIAQDTGLSEASITSAVAVLKDMGLIDVERRGGLGYTFQILCGDVRRDGSHSRIQGQTSKNSRARSTYTEQNKKNTIERKPVDYQEVIAKTEPDPEAVELLNSPKVKEKLEVLGIQSPEHLSYVCKLARKSPVIVAARCVDIIHKANSVKNIIGYLVYGLREGFMPTERNLNFVNSCLKESRGVRVSGCKVNENKPLREIISRKTHMNMSNYQVENVGMTYAEYKRKQDKVLKNA